LMDKGRNSKMSQSISNRRNLMVRMSPLPRKPGTRRYGVKMPVCVIIDTCMPEGQNEIQKINEGIKLLFQAGKNNDNADVSLIASSNERVEVVSDFGPISEKAPPLLKVQKEIPIYESIKFGLDIMGERLEIYENLGIPAIPPSFIIISDGSTCKSGEYVRLKQTDEEYKNTVNLLGQFRKKYNLISVAVGIGDNIHNSSFVKDISSEPEYIVNFDDFNFADFFIDLKTKISSL
jgi:uncharacterized protein YegL